MKVKAHDPYRIVHTNNDEVVVLERQTLNFDTAYHLYSNNAPDAEWVKLQKQVAPGLWTDIAVRHYNYSIAEANNGRS